MALFGPINPEPQQNFLKGMSNVEDLRKMQIANALSQIQQDYAPQMSEAEIGLKRGQEFENRGRGAHYYAEATSAPYRNALLQAQSGHYSHLNALTDAQAARQRKETELAPQELDIRRQQLQQQNSRFGGAYQMARALNAMPAPARAQWIAQNQEAYAGMLAELGNQIPQQAPQNALNAPMQPSETSQQRFAKPSPEQVANLQKANQMYANKALSTAATERQMEGAIQVESIINDPQFQSQATNASMYAGAARKGKAALDALSQKNPAAYEDYLAFKNQTMVLLQNRIKTLDQMGATDKQREELLGLYAKTMDSLSSNPKQFITQLNKLGRTLDTVARAVQKSASPIADVNRLQGYNAIPESTPDLSGLSNEQLMQIAGGGG